MPFTPSRLTALLLVAGLTTVEVGLLDVAVGSASRFALAQEQMSLSIRRSQSGVEVVVQGVGPQPVLQQRLNGKVWEGRLQTLAVRELHDGLQQLSDPIAGLQRVAISGSGNAFNLRVIPEDGQVLREPVVIADGRNLILQFPGLVAGPMLQTGRLDLNTPGRVAQTRYAPPLRPRAVAPPLGDMAVGTMVLQNRSYVNVSGPPVTLTLNNAPAKDAILSIAKLGGYGFIYMPDSDEGNDQSGDGLTRPVTMSFSAETYSRALNSLLLASGLQAKLDGRTLMVGSSVSGKSFGPQISKVFRLNQASSASAADYLASLGAQISKVNVISVTSGDAVAEGVTMINNDFTQESTSLTEVETYGASTGPLRGLSGTADSRLETITLVGDSRLVAVAEAYLKQIDLRQRQVAVKVQILNIDLENIKNIDSSFSARIGNTFIVNENGNAFMNFGDYRPGNSDGAGLLGNGTPYAQPGAYPAGIASVQDNFVIPPSVEAMQSSGMIDGKETFEQVLDANGAPVYVPDNNPAAPDQLLGKVDASGRPIYIPGKDPAKFSYPQNSLYGYLEAAIESTSAKVLAQPTLLVQEGQEAEVQTGTSVITSVSATDTANGSTQFQYEKENAGLTLKVKVSKIDDNGFISMSIDPRISVAEKTGESEGLDIFSITGRSLSSGAIRLRDRQTLVLTGVIQERDIESATKWPILGDLPILGQFFRSSGSNRVKNELVILVTPMILDDESGGAYGYGYKPSTREARQLMRGG